MMRSFRRGDLITFPYVNHRGIFAERKVVFLNLQYGTNDYYLKPTWLINCFCLDRMEYRSFALDNIDINYIVINQNLVELLNK